MEETACNLHFTAVKSQLTAVLFAMTLLFNKTASRVPKTDCHANAVSGQQVIPIMEL